jgi:HEAT repeat protein
VPALVSTLKDKNRCVQRESLKALGKIGSKEAIAYLNKTLSDRDSTCRICDLP